MSKCIKDYRRHSVTYLAGSEYDIDDALVQEHETYFGEPLWATTSKSQEKREAVQKEEEPKKTTKKVAKKTKKEK